MKQFLAIYLGSAATMEKSGWNSLDPAERKKREAAGIQAWTAWMADHEDSIVVHGGPLGKTKRISAAGIADTKNSMSGFIIVKAESHEAAAKLFEKHPHFAVFPGDSVEIMECLPIPGQ